MLHKILDRLLSLHFKECDIGNKLNTLEQDVWRRINTANATIIQPWYDKIVLAFAVPEFRMASLAMALVIGIGFSAILPSSEYKSPNNNIMEMSVFTVNSPYLTSNLIENIK